MVKKFRIILSLLVLVSLISSCATCVHGTRQWIGIESQPANASVWVDHSFAGKTPLVVQMTRKDRHFVRIELEGYEPYEMMFSRKISGWVFGNLIVGGFFGLAIDAVSGGIYTLTPEQFQVQLKANELQSITRKGEQSFITVVLNPDPSWKKIGNLTKVSSP